MAFVSRKFLHKEYVMAHKVDAALEKARAQTTKIESINVLCDKFREIIASNASAEAKVEELDALLGENNTKIDEVINENTPPEPPVE